MRSRRISKLVREALYSGDAQTVISAALQLLEQRAHYGNALTAPAAVRDYLRLAIAGGEHEVFVCVWMDAQHRVIASEEIFRRTLSQTSVYPREIVKRALAVNAAAVIFAHNHPSGVAQPSQADELLTRSLKDALALIDVKVLDHFVVAGTKRCPSPNADCCEREQAARREPQAAAPDHATHGARAVCPHAGRDGRVSEDAGFCATRAAVISIREKFCRSTTTR